MEKRILELLEDPEGKITDVLEVERELARVRGEIEQMEGRLRYLSDRTELTTIVVSAREQREYAPPEAPTFLARLGQAWGDSLLSLQTFGQDLAVAAVFAFPWILTLVVAVAPLCWWARRYTIRANAAAYAHQRSRAAPTSEP